MRYVDNLKTLLALSIFALPRSSPAADITVVGNKYADYDKFIQGYMDSHHLAASLRPESNTASPTPMQAFLVNELPYDEHQGCDQLGYVFTWEKGIKITGSIEPGVSDKLKKVIEDSKHFDDDRQCGLPVLIDSPGGDLTTALDIGRQIREQHRFVIVPEDGVCLSSCIFVLMAARYEDSVMSFSKSFALTTSSIGVHWPELTGAQKDEYRRIAMDIPALVFKGFGEYWTNINKYSIDVSESNWLPIALLNTVPLQTGTLYMVDSALERKLVGINTVVLPSENDRLDNSVGALRNLCLLNMIDPESPRIFDSFQYELQRNGIYLLYYPKGNKVCVAREHGKEVSLIVSPYGGDSNFQNDRADVVTSTAETNKEIKAFRQVAWRELNKVGLTEKILGTKYGTGKTLNELTKDEVVSAWSFFVKLNERFACVICGNMRGTEVFSGDQNCNVTEPTDKELLAYIAKLKKAGFMCDIQLNEYMFAKLLVSGLAKENPGWGFSDGADYKIVPESLQQGSVKISEECANQYGVCSVETGRYVSGELVKSRNGGSK